MDIAGPINVTDNITGTIQISNSDLAPDKYAIGTANYTITQADINAGSVTNAAVVTGTFGNNTVTSNATATVTSVQSPALTIVKSASPTTYSTVGQIITYTYTVTNSGNVNIAGPITVTDNKIGTVNITDEDLIPGQSVTGTANYTIKQADLNARSVTNAAFATGTYNGAEVKSNVSSSN